MAFYYGTLNFNTEFKHCLYELLPAVFQFLKVKPHSERNTFIFKWQVTCRLYGA